MATFKFEWADHEGEETGDLVVQVPDYGIRPYVDLADEAEEKARRLVMDRLGNNDFDLWEC